MSPNRIIVARFSPTGRTRRLMSMIAQGLAGTALPVEELDLTDRWEREEARTFGKGDLVFLGVPVYFGRVPLPMQSLAKWTGTAAAPLPGHLARECIGRGTRAKETGTPRKTR